VPVLLHIPTDEDTRSTRVEQKNRYITLQISSYIVTQYARRWVKYVVLNKSS
jgi:hypothetical protein